MDSIIPIGQKNTLADMILSGDDNHPLMLDKDLYDSWKSRMELYMQNRENGRMILESVKHGPLIWLTIEENGVTRTKKYAELSATEKTQAVCDLKATNIIFRGLPSDIYSLVNHRRVAKDLWERIQLLMQGTSLTKQERECKLKFVTDVKLVKDLHTTNFDQLHAYLQQHELYANEVCIMCERNHDPLALVANHQQTPSHFNTYQSSYNKPQFQQQFSSSSSPQYGSSHPTQHYSTTHPSTPLVISYPSTPYSNAYTSTFHQDAYPQPQSIPHIEYTVSTVNQQTHLAEFPHIDSGLAVLMFKQGDDPIEIHPTHLPTIIFVNKDNPIANESLSAELKRYKEQVKFLEERQNVDLDFKKEINSLKQTLSEQSKEKELLTKTFNVFKNESKEKEAKNIDTEIALEKKFKELDNNIRPMLYDGNVIAKETNVISIADSEETLMLEEESRSKMLLKQSDPMVLEKKIEAPRELPKKGNGDLLNDVTKVQTGFNQMEAAIQQYHVDKQCFKIQKKQFLIENNRLLDQIISQDIMNIVVNYSVDVNTYVKVNSSVVMNDSLNYVEMCNKCLDLEAELIKQHNMV
ncbi:hypothetical protein Tco_0691085 [Tanacetum coccineum]